MILLVRLSSPLSDYRHVFKVVYHHGEVESARAQFARRFGLTLQEQGFGKEIRVPDSVQYGAEVLMRPAALVVKDLTDRFVG
jgi:hypothetical protein